MKSLILISLSLILISCNPFISKELRMTIRCNRKLEKVLKKCPELKDTVFINIPFEVIVPKIEIRDSISVQIDTVNLLKYITKDEIRYIVRSISIDTMYVDSLYRLQISLYNGVLSFDVEIAERTIKDVVKAPIRVIKPKKLSPFEKFSNFIGKSWTLFILIIIAITSYLLANKYFSKN